MNKIPWLHAAEIFDSWRVVPRGLVIFVLGWLVAITDRLLVWYIHLPAAERTLEATGFGATIITTVTGLWTLVFKIYVQTGRDWNAQPMATSTVSVTQTASGQPAA